MSRFSPCTLSRRSVRVITAKPLHLGGHILAQESSLVHYVLQLCYSTQGRGLCHAIFLRHVPMHMLAHSFLGISDVILGNDTIGSCRSLRDQCCTLQRAYSAV